MPCEGSFSRSRMTVDGKAIWSLATAMCSPMPSWRPSTLARCLTSRRNHTAFHLHVCTSPCYLSTQGTAPSALPYQPDPAHLSFPSSHCPPLVPSKSNTREQCAEALLGRRRSNRAAALGTVGSLARRLVASPSSRLGCRAPRALPHRNTVRRPVGGRLVVVAQMSVCLSCLGRPVRTLRSASTRPVSGVRASGVRVSGCPASRVGVRAFRVGVRGVRSGDFVERVGATGSRTARRAWVWPPCHICERLGQLPDPEPAQAVLGQRRRRAGPGRRRGGARAAGQVLPPGRPGTRRLSARTVRRSRKSVRAVCTPAAAWLGAGCQGQGAGIRPTITWAGPEAATTSGARVMDLGLGAPASEILGLDRLCGPTAAQAGRGRDRVGRASPVSWENGGGPART